MSIVRYHPIRELMNMNNTMDRIFTGADRLSQTSIPVDITESEDEFTIIAEIPGFSSDEIDIEVKRDGISIKAEHIEVTEESEEEKSEEETTSPRLIYSERRSRRMIRKLAFGKEIEAKQATSKLENGILTITLPKAEKEKAVKLVPQTN